GIGSALIQIENNKEKVVSYYSRVLNSSEKNYSAIEIELLAIVCSIKRFHNYLLGQKFEIITDSNSLTYLMRTKDLNSRLMHWSLFMQNYDFTFTYRKGESNKLCDFLSRFPVSSSSEGEQLANDLNDFHSAIREKSFSQFENSFENEICAFISLLTENKDSLNNIINNEVVNLNEFSYIFLTARNELIKDDTVFDIFFTEMNDIKKLQNEDKYLKNIIEVLKGKSLNKNKSIRKAAFNYELKDGKLFRVIVLNNEFKRVLALPKKLIPHILASAHDCILSGGHLGIRKTFERIKNRFYWRTMHNDVIKWVTSCNTCQKIKPQPKKCGKLMPILPGARPFEKIGLDIIGMLPTTARGNRFIIVVTCYLTKFAITKSVKHVTAKDVAEFLLHDLILKYSAFDVLISDNGVQFRSEIIRNLNELFSVKHKFTTPYKPSTAGLVERCNRQILQLIKSYTDKNKHDWDIILPFITHIYNVSYHTSTKFTPFYLVHGYEAKLPIDMYCERNENFDKDDYVYQISVNLKKAREHAKENIIKSQTNYKTYFDEKRDDFEFEIGDKCFVKYPIRTETQGNKLLIKWLGPLTVVNKINSVLYEVESENHDLYFDKIHISKMRPCSEREKDENFQNKQKIEQRPKRIRKIPKYLKDYYLQL
ncbi:pol polyprotein-like protein, partial [Dinothrombium tinctorium]